MATAGRPPKRRRSGPAMVPAQWTRHRRRAKAPVSRGRKSLYESIRLLIGGIDPVVSVIGIVALVAPPFLGQLIADTAAASYRQPASSGRSPCVTATWAIASWELRDQVSVAGLSTLFAGLFVLALIFVTPSDAVTVVPDPTDPMGYVMALIESFISFYGFSTLVFALVAGLTLGYAWVMSFRQHVGLR